MSPGAARRHNPETQFLGFLNELSGGDEHPPGDASRIDSILMFCAFSDDSDRIESKF